MSHSLQYLWIDALTPLYAQAIDLRTRLLRDPLGLVYYAEDLAQEWDMHHLVAVNEQQKVLGCLVLTELDQDTIKMRQVAVDTDQQGKGIGAQMVKVSEEYARRRSYKTMSLHARHVAVDFYLRLDYEIYGEPFTEVSVPHRSMRKLL